MINTRIRSGTLMIGIGLGALAEGVVFAELLQWHGMLSAAMAPETLDALRVSLAAGGMFHAVAWLIVLAGVAALWSAFGRPGTLPATRVFAGYLLLGWGWYNLLEGIINHHFLQLHHVRDLPLHVPALDWVYLLGGGAGFIALGLALSRRKAERTISDRRAGYERRGTGPMLER
jgi:uncharacterized membrane protein